MEESLGKLITVSMPQKTGTAKGENVFLYQLTPSVRGRILAYYKGEAIVGPPDLIAYEPYIKKEFGIPQEEEITCFYEKSCGAVLYTEAERERRYLLIQTESGHIGFPKGHIELDETEEETALREIYEETGFNVRLDKTFRMQYQYYTRDNTSKRCVYFLAHYDYAPAKIQEEEIKQSWLVNYQTAMQMLNFIQDKEILSAVERRLGH